MRLADRLSLGAEASAIRAALDAAWDRLPAALRGPTQFLGRQYAGCAATIGAMPRCDFSCSGCYLTSDANGARPLPMAALREQLALIRRWLGPGGNLQLTDGELTLRAEGELLELIACARNLGLVPMLMTHGETLRRDPDLFERLVRGGLSEVCFHVDTTMRGRRDHYATVRTESELDGLRGEFADLVRRMRQHTGRRIEAASTVTVTRGNLAGVPGIVRWFLANADAFKMLSFQPVAAVGRTSAALEGVTATELWAKIAEGAADPQLLRGAGSLGHDECSRFVQGLVGRDGRRFVPLYDRSRPAEMRTLAELLGRLGGQTFRNDDRARATRRAGRALLRHGWFLATRVLPSLLRRAWATGTLRPRYFCLVSHHFMSEAELQTPLGRERLASCAFRVPVDGEMQSMCAVNALGLRQKLYSSTRRPSAAVASRPAAGIPGGRHGG